jgi:heme-degrading monooxygenase HmoA
LCRHASSLQIADYRGRRILPGCAARGRRTQLPQESAVLVVTRFRVPESDGPAFRERAEAAVNALSVRPGYRGARLGRAADDPAAWVLVTEWAGVGAWRRALSSYDVKMHATPLLAEAIDEPSAYEVLYFVDSAEGDPRRDESDRAVDADTAGPGGPLR